MLQKSSPILSQIDPKSIQKPSWSLSWANAWKKLDFERPKNNQEASKSAKMRPKTVPERPKSLPNGAQDLPKSNLSTFCLPLFYNSKFTPIFHRFFIDSLSIFCKLLTASILQNHAKTYVFSMFFDKSLFSKIMRKIKENPLQNLAKTIPKPAKVHPESQKINQKLQKINSWRDKAS